MLLNDVQCTIDKKEVLKSLLFLPHTMTLDERAERAVDAGIDEAYTLVQARAVYETFGVERCPGGYRLAGGAYLISARYVLEHLQQIEYVTIFACTIGEELPRRVEALIAEKRTTEAAILNAAGSEAVEGVAEQVNEVIRREAKLRKYQTRRRFSPGYGDWLVTEQKALLSLVKAHTIGIRLTETCLMLPEKSISAIVGWWR